MKSKRNLKRYGKTVKDPESCEAFLFDHLLPCLEKEFETNCIQDLIQDHVALCKHDVGYPQEDPAEAVKFFMDHVLTLD